MKPSRLAHPRGHAPAHSDEETRLSLVRPCATARMSATGRVAPDRRRAYSSDATTLSVSSLLEIVAARFGFT